jgi:hypothetical protein
VSPADWKVAFVAAGCTVSLVEAQDPTRSPVETDTPRLPANTDVVLSQIAETLKDIAASLRKLTGRDTLVPHLTPGLEASPVDAERFQGLKGV